MNPDSVKRCSLTVRTTPSIRFQLEAAAKLNGRSLTQELEFRLERTFALDDMRQIIREELRGIVPVKTQEYFMRDLPLHYPPGFYGEAQVVTPYKDR